MIIIKKQILSIAIISLFTALMCSNAFADHHGGDHHGDNEGSFGFYFGSGPGYSYYPYSPYYYPYGNYIVVSPDGGSHRAYTKPDVTVMKAQVELINQGYYQGSADGILGSQTKEAIIAFQHNKGLAETGQLDDATLKALNVKK